MKQISKQDMARLNAALVTLAGHKAALEAVIAKAQAEIDDVLEQANGVRESIRGMLEDLHRMAEEYHDERSERWQASDAGQSYKGWVDALYDAEVAFGGDLTLEISTDLLAEIEDLEGYDIPEVPE